MQNRKLSRRLLGAAAFAVTGAIAMPAQAEMDKRPDLKAKAEAALEQCRAVAQSCAEVTDRAPGVLVFPEVTSASLVVGGAGANGVLWVNGQIDGFYRLAETSVGVQAGYRESSQVYALDAASLKALRGEGTWKIGSDTEVTVVSEGASAEGVSGTGGTKAFVFNQDGLNAGVSLEGIRIHELESEDLVKGDGKS